MNRIEKLAERSPAELDALLCAHLKPGEEVAFWATASARPMADGRGLNRLVGRLLGCLEGRAVLTLTPRRIVLLRFPGPISGSREPAVALASSISLRRVASIQVERGLLGSSLAVEGKDGRKMRFFGLKPGNARDFQACHGVLERALDGSRPAPSAACAAGDPCATILPFRGGRRSPLVRGRGALEPASSPSCGTPLVSRPA